jgi:hypothetical protein
VLAGLCQHWSVFVRASLLANQALDRGDDAMAVRRWNITANQAYMLYVRAALEFGLTPASKARVKAGEGASGPINEEVKLFDGTALG